MNKMRVLMCCCVGCHRNCVSKWMRWRSSWLQRRNNWRKKQFYASTLRTDYRVWRRSWPSPARSTRRYALVTGTQSVVSTGMHSLQVHAH